MTNEGNNISSLSAQAAYKITRVTKTTAYFDSLTPRWLPKFMEWKPLETGIFRRNKVIEGNTPLDMLLSESNNTNIPEGFVDYDLNPREYTLDSISTIINIHTRISDVYSGPYDQIKEQLRMSIECVKEKQESQIINSDDYGLLKNASSSQRIQTRKGRPTPDDMDELISKVWKEPSFFLAHPRAIAAFGRECTRRGVPPATVNFFGSPFLTWRGIPIVPTDKLFVDGQTKPMSQTGKTNILLVRTGEKKQGVIGLYQANLPGNQTKGLSVRFMAIDKAGIASYLISLYSSASILAEDAVAVLENVDVGNYYEYE
jgi:hypothetical protein